MSSEYDGTGVSPQTFQGIVTERIAEIRWKAEQKRVDDVRRIQQMKSPEGANPIEIFPKEIWIKILNELTPADRGNIWKVHNVFRDIMESTQVRDNLFPQILKMPVDEFWGEPRNGDDDHGQDQTEKVLLANYLELRSVSKSLRNAVDNFLEEDLLEQLHRIDFDSSPVIPIRTLMFDYDGSPRDIEKLDRALAFIQMNPKSRPRPRFIRRSFTVFMDTSYVGQFFEKFQHFVSKFTLLLKLAGAQIWHFELRIHDTSVGNRSKLSIPLNEWLGLLPNLKWLDFSFFFRSSSETCFDIEAFRSPDLPKLKNLERIDLFLQGSEQVESICRAILTAYSHIKVLGMINAGGCGYGGFNAASSTVESPKALKASSEGHLYQIEKRLNTNWPLQRLTLSLDMQNDSIIPLFQFLQKFTTLEQLSLGVRRVTIGGGIDFLRLPNLKDFEMEICSPRVIYDAPIAFFFSLQFLLYAKYLRSLNWINETREGVEDLKGVMERYGDAENIIDFGGGWRDLRKSNIWNVFPYLEKVKVSVMDVVEGRGLQARVREYRRGQ